MSQQAAIDLFQQAAASGSYSPSSGPSHVVSGFPQGFFCGGAGGAIYINNVPVAFIKDWNFSASVEVYGADTFYNPIIAGVYFKRKDLLGMAEATISITGYALRQGHEGILPGYMYHMALGMTKAPLSSARVIIVPNAVCKSISYKAAADSASPIEFSAEFDYSGVLSNYLGFTALTIK